MLDQELPGEISAFVADLRRQDVAAATAASYATDLRMAARWFADTTGEAFAAAAVTPTDLRDYRAHLRTVERRAVLATQLIRDEPAAVRGPHLSRAPAVMRAGAPSRRSPPPASHVRCVACHIWVAVQEWS